MLVLVLAGQIGLIFSLGETKEAKPRSPASTPVLRISERQTSELLSLTDPTLFALPHGQGFSGKAWLESKAPPEHSFGWSEPAAWLPLRKESLGAEFSRFVATNAPDPLETAGSPGPALVLPNLPAEQPLRNRSDLKLSGALKTRRLVSNLDLPSWPASDLLTNSVVNLAVIASGQPISATLLVSSGDKLADEHALTQAMAARFNSIEQAGPSRIAKPISGLTWGQMIFEWHTVASTNSSPPAQK